MGFSARELVNGWVHDCSGDLRRRASKADNAYKTNPLRQYCLAYGRALRAAAYALHATWEREVERIGSVKPDDPAGSEDSDG